MFKKEDVYALLEEKMLSYQEISTIPIAPVNEDLVPIQQTEVLLTKQIEPAMLAITGEDIYVRETVAKMLGTASLALASIGKDLQLEIVYGYRHPSIQVDDFNKLSHKLAGELPELDEQGLFEATNRFIAALEIAGHPTGSSVDLQVLIDGVPIDMGTKSREFVPDTYVFSPFISKEAWQNRQLIRGVMLGNGFAPYDGEWWHFSYGDREWAAYYNKPTAIYGPIEFSI